MTNDTQAATPYFQVRVTCGIGMYIGEWTGNEQKYEDRSCCLLETTNQAEAEALYARLAGAANSRTPPRTKLCKQCGKPFVVVAEPGYEPLYCSKKCVQKARNAKLGRKRDAATLRQVQIADVEP